MADHLPQRPLAVGIPVSRAILRDTFQVGSGLAALRRERADDVAVRNEIDVAEIVVGCFRAFRLC
jgi:hypothetical protein